MAVSLIVGLGNPGDRYAGTRHNVGFQTADRLLQGAGGRWESDEQGLTAAVRFGERSARLAKPLTYMNESGRMVAALARFYRIAPADILVVSDDMDLPLGRLRIRLKGSSGGQNGLKSVLQHLGTTDVPRLRLGVGPKPPEWDAADFVLSKFQKSELDAVGAMVERAAEAVEHCVAHGLEAAMNKFNPAAADA